MARRNKRAAGTGRVQRSKRLRTANDRVFRHVMDSHVSEQVWR